MEKVFAVIDLKSFYATVECIKRGLDPFKAPLVVCDEFRGPGSIIMSVTPYLKTLGCKNVMRRFDLPPNINYIYARPNMEAYVLKSTEFNALLLDYFADEDIHPYSIDETFIHLTPYLSLYKLSPYDLMLKIMGEVKSRLGLISASGIGPNMFMAKCALDIEAKKTKEQVAQWFNSDVQDKLWKVTPITKIWGISKGYEKRLASMGFFNMEDVARAPKGQLKDALGILGEQIWEHANGIDESDMKDQYHTKSKSFTSGQVLHRDYALEEVPTLIREMCDDICGRLRKYDFKAGLVSLGVLETRPSSKTYGKSMSLLKLSRDNDELFDAFMLIFSSLPLQHPIRQVFLGVGDVKNANFEQISLFDEMNSPDQNRLWDTLDEIHARFGKDKLMRANALTKSSTYLRRANQIGGHRK
ncbi:MAG TPA: damage repair protein [Bacilli bacterium]|nr:damage repair protein [Bacilli bacterium]